MRDEKRKRPLHDAVALLIKDVAQRPEAKEGGREEEEKRFEISTA
jgi:hypothetical protein